MLLAACSGGDGAMIEPPGPPPPPPPAAPPDFRLSLNPSSSNPNKTIGLLLGGTLQLTPRLVSSSGDTIQPTAAVSYLSRAANTVSVDAGGFLTALATGNASIEASTVYNNKVLADTLSVSVICSAELTVTVTPVNPGLAVGGRFTPSIVVTTCGGRITISDTFTWAVVGADLEPIVSSVVSVNPATGETVALAPGTALIVVRGQKFGFPLSAITVTVR